MQALMQNHPFASMIVGGLLLAVVSVLLCHFAVWAWFWVTDGSLGDALHSIFHRRSCGGCTGPNCRAFDAARERLRAKLFAGGYGKHKAYFIAPNGFVLVADAADYYLALFAGVDDFWDCVAVGHSGELDGGFLTAPLEQIDFGDGKGHFTRIHAASGETFVDADLTTLLVSPDPYLCARVTAEEFKDAIVQRKAEAAKRAKGDGRVEDGLCVHGAVV